MAGQFESGSQLQELLGVLARRKWQILVPAVYVLSLGIAFAAFLPRVYVARAQVNLFPTRVGDDAFIGDPLAASGGRETYNAVHQLKQDNRIAKVLEDLEWPEYVPLAEVRKFDFRQRLRKRISVYVHEKPRNEGSTFIDVSFEAGSPQRAAGFLQQLIVLWLQDVYERDAINRRRERDVLQVQRADLQRELRELQEQFADKLKLSGLSVDQIAGQQRYAVVADPLQARIQATNDKLLETERQIELAEGRIAQLERELENAPTTLAEPAEVGGESNQAKIAQLRELITAQRNKQVGLKRLHSQYRLAEDEIRRLEAKIEELQGRERRGEIVLRPSVNPQRLALQDQLVQARLELAAHEQDRAFYAARLAADQATQRERIDLRLQLEELKVTIEQRQVLKDEIDAQYAQQQQALAILENATVLYDITQDARADNEPVRPNVPLIWLFSLLGGLGLGLAVAGVAEFTQPGYRTPSELARALGVPVLGVIQEVPTTAERRALLVRRTVVLVSTVLILGGLHWFVWTWSNHPERLDTDVVRALEDMREELR